MSLDIDIRKKTGAFSLRIQMKTQARRIGVLGASGAGKSMTLKAVAGIVTPDEGRIAADGKEFFNSAEKVNLPPRERKVGYLFQNYALFPSMTVRKNIEAGIRGSAKLRRKRADEMIERFHLQALENHLPAALSGGQQQRTALARIMACEPELILLDEPFSALDIYLKDQMQQELLYQLEGYPGTVIMVTHNRDEVYRFSEELFVIDSGHVDASGKTKDVFAHPGTAAAARITGCKNISPAKRLDDHHFAASGWGITISTREPVPENLAAVGYRAHEFLPVWGEKQENCIPFVLESSAQLQFERNYYIKPANEQYNREDVLTWFVQRNFWPVLDEKGMPDYLQFQEKDLLFLRA